MTHPSGVRLEAAAYRITVGIAKGNGGLGRASTRNAPAGPSPGICGTALGRRVIAAVGLDRTTLAVHGARPRPVGWRVIRTRLVAALRRRIEDAVDPQHLLATATVRGIGVEDLARLCGRTDLGCPPPIPALGGNCIGRAPSPRPRA